MFDLISNEAKEFIFIAAVLFWLGTVVVGMIFAFASLFNAKQHVALVVLAIVLTVLPVCAAWVRSTWKKQKKE